MTASDEPTHVRLVYLYRDGDNYKRLSDVVVDNEDGLSVTEAGSRLRVACESGQWFNAAQVGLAELLFEDGVDDSDHSWHEFVSLVPTADAVSETRSLTRLVCEFERTSRSGWRIDFDRLDPDAACDR